MAAQNRMILGAYYFRILFVLVFVLPVAAVSLYLLLLATDRYVSSAAILVTEERGARPAGLDLSAIGLPSTTADRESLVVKAFLESREMLIFLDKEIGLRRHYSTAGADFVSRLDADASIEDVHRYFLRFLDVSFDTNSKILRIEVQSFDRDYSRRIVETMLARSQEFINQLNDHVTHEQLSFFLDELRRAEGRLREAKERMVRFQQEHGIYTPETEGETIVQTVVQLEQELARKRSELSAMLGTLTAEAPRAQALAHQVAALQAQIRDERQRLAGTQGHSLSELHGAYREIALNLEFVTNAYKSALSATEQARIDAARKLKFLIVVYEPTLADRSEYPDRPYLIATTALLALMLFAILSLVLAIIREHL